VGPLPWRRRQQIHSKPDYMQSQPRRQHALLSLTLINNWHFFHSNISIGKHCDVGKINLSRYMTDFQVLGPRKQETVISGIPSACTHAHLVSAWTVGRMLCVLKRVRRIWRFYIQNTDHTHGPPEAILGIFSKTVSTAFTISLNKTTWMVPSGRQRYALYMTNCAQCFVPTFPK
jgi:hypothetical protein